MAYPLVSSFFLVWVDLRMLCNKKRLLYIWNSVSRNLFFRWSKRLLKISVFIHSTLASVVAVYGAISTPKVKVVIEVHNHLPAGVEKYKQQSYTRDLDIIQLPNPFVYTLLCCRVRKGEKEGGGGGLLCDLWPHSQSLVFVWVQLQASGG